MKPEKFETVSASSTCNQLSFRMGIVLPLTAKSTLHPRIAAKSHPDRHGVALCGANLDNDCRRPYPRIGCPLGKLARKGAAVLALSDGVFIPIIHKELTRDGLCRSARDDANPIVSRDE